ncbi:TonB-dependent receptor [Sphingomonas sp. CL5.1]|nr:TonB-dependent receptor [Sphingomonas sp. CL5.1]
MATALVAVAAPAAAQAQAYNLDIPAGSLGDSLRALGQTSAQQIIFSEASVRGMAAPALHGSYTIDEALGRLLAGTALRTTRTSGGVFYVGAPAEAPEAAAGNAAPPGPDVIVTGTRIRSTSQVTAAPVTRISSEQFTERGVVQVGDMLNQVTSNVPELPQAPFSGVPAGSGQTFPNLFGLGEGRTLTLLNGRRMVTSSSGLGARVVDVNTIPAGLIDHIDVVEAGGAAVYGSDAIAGVVNYVLKRNFSGVEIDAQNMVSGRGKYSQPFARITAGKNFADGKGNIAVDVEYSRTDPLLETDLPYFERGPRSVTNFANTGPNDGQPPTVIAYGGHLWRFNGNGVIFANNASAPSNLLRINGSPVQFSPDGQSIIPYNTGAIQLSSPTVASSTALGGEGFDTRLLSTFLTGVERYTGSAIGHYDFSDHVRLSGEFLYSHQRGTDTLATEDIQRAVGGGATFSAVSFTKTNPFLTASQIAALSAASPGFAAGGPLWLSKYFDILPTREGISTTNTWRALLALDGDFTLGDHNFYWSLSGSHGETNSVTGNWAQYFDHFNNAINSVRNGSGQIVCAINADADPTNDDPSCAPVNPFSNDAVSAAARAYVSTYLRQTVRNKQDDFLATLGGEIVKLPAGAAQFSVAFEHRYESAAFIPSDTLLNGYGGYASVAEAGRYHTDEYSGELLIPIMGKDFKLPLVEALVATGSFRHVDNSLAGKENVWGAGLRWTVGWGLTLRASRSRNFSAPTLDQQFAPVNVNPGNPASDPCDVTLIGSGSNPSARRANCIALFNANPGYGLNTLPAGVANTAENRLANFNDPSINTGRVTITTQGNPGLKNEISNTLTFGAVYEPRYIPGLSISADYIRVDLKDALSPFAIGDFLNACYDNVVQPAAICSTFTRDADGYLATGTEETFNAGSLRYRGEVYKVNYHLPLSRVFDGDPGTLDFHVEATHNRYFNTSVTGFDNTRSDGTVAAPDWRLRFDLNYGRGPFRAFYSFYFLPDAKASFTATADTTTVPVLQANATHSISFQYDAGRRFTFRFGVNNLTNRTPPPPSRTYGDIYGRRFFAGAQVHF